MKRAIFAALSAVLATGALLAPAAPASAAVSTVYDATEVAPNVPSIGFEAHIDQRVR